MTVNVEMLKKFRTDFDASMALLEKKYGVKVDLGMIRYSRDGSGFSGTISAVSTKTVSDPYMQGVAAEYINTLKKFPDTRNTLLKIVKVSPTSTQEYVIVGVKGKSFIVKYLGQPESDCRRVSFELGNYIHNMANDPKTPTAKAAKVTPVVQATATI